MKPRIRLVEGLWRCDGHYDGQAVVGIGTNPVSAFRRFLEFCAAMQECAVRWNLRHYENR